MSADSAHLFNRRWVSAADVIIQNGRLHRPFYSGFVVSSLLDAGFSFSDLVHQIILLFDLMWFGMPCYWNGLMHV